MESFHFSVSEVSLEIETLLWYRFPWNACVTARCVHGLDKAMSVQRKAENSEFLKERDVWLCHVLCATMLAGHK